MEKKDRVTRADVAREAGVSETIVSYVINNKRYVAKEKRERVEAAIARLHYRPNNAARALRGLRSNQLLFIADQITNEYFSRIVSEIDRFGYEAGFMIALCANRNTPEFVSQVVSRSYDGIIISSISFPYSYLQSFSDVGIPVVLFEHRLHGALPDRVACLASGLYSGVRQAVRHLRETGKQAVIYIDRISRRGNTSGDDDLRLRGYLDEMAAGGCQVPEAYLVRGAKSEEELKVCVAQLLLSHPEVDGIVARNDMVACLAMEAAKSVGRRIPEELGVVGFDNSTVSKLCTPPLTTLEMDREGIARKTIEMMQRMLNGSRAEDVSFDTRLIVRESTVKREEKGKTKGG